MAAFDTGNVFHKGTLELNIGARQTQPGIGPATGLQVYHGGGSYAFTDQFTMGVELQNYLDPVAGPVAGIPGIPQINTTQLALWGKYQFLKNERWAVAALVSAENFVKIKSDFWGGISNDQRNVTIGAFKLPISYSVSPKWQLHLAPGITIAPDTLGGDQFYGTIGTIGAGFSYLHSPRLALFGSVEAPVSGENTINSDASWSAKPVWSLGARYNATPRVALEGYLTNGWGTSPATSAMTFWPDGDHILGGLRAVYTPGANRPVSYRTLTLPPTQQQLSLQQDGFTLGAAETLEPGTMRFELWGGSQEQAGTSINFSPDRDVELQFIFEQYADSPSAPPALVPTTHVRYMVGPKLRLMDQDNGNAFSLAARMLYGRQISGDALKIGVFYADLAARYKTGTGLAFTASPKVAAFEDTEIVGLGLGLNYGFDNGLQLLAEVTPVAMDGEDPTWAVGARYHFGRSGFSLDAQATNAIGRHGIGSMVAQDEIRFTLSLSKTFDLRGLKFY